jgi:hypothetical protein
MPSSELLHLPSELSVPRKLKETFEDSLGSMESKSRSILESSNSRNIFKQLRNRC